MRLPLSSIILWFKSIVLSAGLLFEITDTESLCIKSALRPRPSKCNSSNHMERFNTCKIRSNVSLESLVWETLSPRKKVLYSNADTIAIKSLKVVDNYIIKFKIKYKNSNIYKISYFGSKWSKSRRFIVRFSWLI